MVEVADILAETYFDEMSVFRPVRKEVDDETIFLKGLDGDKVLEKVPCSLSSIKGGKLVEGIISSKTNKEYIIFARPEVVVKENDYIVLTVNAGGVPRKDHHLRAGSSRLFAGSHVEIMVSEETRA